MVVTEGDLAVDGTLLVLGRDGDDRFPGVDISGKGTLTISEQDGDRRCAGARKRL